MAELFPEVDEQLRTILGEDYHEDDAKWEGVRGVDLAEKYANLVRNEFALMHEHFSPIEPKNQEGNQITIDALKKGLASLETFIGEDLSEYVKQVGEFEKIETSSGEEDELLGGAMESTDEDLLGGSELSSWEEEEEKIRKELAQEDDEVLEKKEDTSTDEEIEQHLVERVIDSLDVSADKEEKTLSSEQIEEKVINQRDAYTDEKELDNLTKDVEGKQ